MERVKLPKNRQLRIAVYCRLASEREKTHISIEDRLKKYCENNKVNPDLCMTAVYMDIGVSGLSTKNRPEFKRMIDDCLAGKIDYIVTKSVSHFSRNILDFLEYTKMLKNCGVGIIFENENMDTLKINNSPIFEIYESIYKI